MSPDEVAAFLGWVTSPLNNSVVVCWRNPDAAKSVAHGLAPAAEDLLREEEEPAPAVFRTWIEVKVCNIEDKPVPGIRYRIELSDGTTETGRTNQEGRVHLPDIPSGPCNLKLWRADSNPYHTAVDGDCIHSLGSAYGVNPLAIWGSKDNKHQFEQRKNPNIIHPGDRIYIPQEIFSVSGLETGRVHTIHIGGSVCCLRLVVDISHLTQQKSVNYEVVLDDGTTHHDRAKAGSRGKPTQFSIISTAKNGVLRVFLDENDPDNTVEFDLALGFLCPSEETRGLQARLQNLGYYIGKNDSVMGPKTKAALREYEREFRAEGDGETSASGDLSGVRKSLEREHGS